MGKRKINIRGLLLVIRRKYLNFNTAIIAIALIVAFSWAWGALSMMERNYALQKELDDKQRQLQLAELESISLELQKKYYQTREYQELAARKNLGLAMPGERVLILPVNTVKIIDSSKVATAKSGSAQSNFDQWMKFLTGGNIKKINT